MRDADVFKARVLEAAAGTPSPTRREGRRRARIGLVASLALAILVFEAAGGLAHSAGRPYAITVQIALGWACFAAAAAWLVLWRGRSTLGRPPALMLAAAVATPLVLVAFMHSFHGTYVEPFARVGWRCLGLTLAIAAVPLRYLLAMRGGSEPRGPSALGAAIGAVCAAWASVFVDLWCPLTNLLHLLAGHALPIVLLAVAGAVLGRRVLGVGAR